jgi:hypothetical protein
MFYGKLKKIDHFDSPRQLKAENSPFELYSDLGCDHLLKSTKVSNRCILWSSIDQLD